MQVRTSNPATSQHASKLAQKPTQSGKLFPPNKIAFLCNSNMRKQLRMASPARPLFRTNGFCEAKLAVAVSITVLRKKAACIMCATSQWLQIAARFNSSVKQRFQQSKHSQQTNMQSRLAQPTKLAASKAKQARSRQEASTSIRQAKQQKTSQKTVDPHLLALLLRSATIEAAARACRYNISCFPFSLRDDNNNDKTARMLVRPNKLMDLRSTRVGCGHGRQGKTPDSRALIREVTLSHGDTICLSRNRHIVQRQTVSIRRLQLRVLADWSFCNLQLDSVDSLRPASLMLNQRDAIAFDGEGAPRSRTGTRAHQQHANNAQRELNIYICEL